MNCPKCGTQLSEGATFCPHCGSSTGNGYRNPTPPNGNNYGGGGRGQNNNTTVIIIVAIVAAVVCILAAIITFAAYNQGEKNAEATPTPMPTPTIQATPDITTAPAPTVQVVYVTEPPSTASQSRSNTSSQSGYKSFYSDEYAFKCDYPASFVAYNDGGTLTLHTVRSQDGTADEKIVAKPNEGETPNSEYKRFLNMHPGTVEYDTIGSSYFAINVDNGVTEYYKYCKFENGNLYWFEMYYPSSQHDLYDKYINDIYRSITINGRSLKYN